jgi:hypothetical protein
MTFDREEIEHLAQAMENEVGSAHALRQVLRELARFKGKVSAGLVRAPVEEALPWEPKPMPPAVLLRDE